MKRTKESARRDPLEVALCVGLMFTAICQVWLGPSSTTIAAALPNFWRYVYISLIISGCAAVLVGVASKLVWGLILEQVGLMALSWSLIAFGVQTAIVQLDRGTFTLTAQFGAPTVVSIGIGLLLKRRSVLADLHSYGKLDWSLSP